MVQINFALREVNCKIVYYGPGLSGKTTNLEIVHKKAPESNKGELTSIATEGDRTLFFDFMPLDLGTIAGMRTRFQLYTVPGQVYYNSTRKLVLQGVDGVVFVADSSAAKMEENLESLENLKNNLAEYGKDARELPIVLQYNKRDLPDALSVDELNARLNPWGAPHFEAVAITGEGVFPTLKCLSGLVLETLNRDHREAPASASSSRSGVPVAAGASQAGTSQAGSSHRGAPVRAPVTGPIPVAASGLAGGGHAAPAAKAAPAARVATAAKAAPGDKAAHAKAAPAARATPSAAARTGPETQKSVIRTGASIDQLASVRERGSGPRTGPVNLGSTNATGQSAVPGAGQSGRWQPPGRKVDATPLQGPIRAAGTGASGSGGPRQVNLPSDKSFPWLLVGLGALILLAAAAILVTTGLVDVSL